MPDLDAIRRMLEPLDLTPLFQVPSGDILRGLGGREPEMSVSGVHTDALGASLGPGRRAPEIVLTIIDHGVALSIRSVAPRRFATDFLAGDPDRIEEVHAPVALTGEEALAEFRGRLGSLGCRAVLRRFLARAETALSAARRNREKVARTLIGAARWCLSGLCLAETGTVTPALESLVAWADEGWLTDLARADGRRPLGGNPGKAAFYLSEIEALLDRLAEAAADPARPEGPIPAGPILDWVEGYGVRANRPQLDQ